MTRSALLAVLAVVALAACTSSGARGITSTIAVTSTGPACQVVPPSATAGTIVFTVQNTGSAPTAFALRRADGSVVGELEGIEPGAVRDLVLQVRSGEYETICGADRAPFPVRVQ